jgi:hypothetical protein
MRRREPPPLATWMLRHLIAGDRDEALEGDLLEVFRLGRSDAWYWRQVVAACVVSWSRSVQARGSVLVFAILWSMLSPLWYATLERIETSDNFDRGGQIFGPLWLPLVLVIWVILHAAFLWAGLLVYRIAHIILRRPLQAEDLRRAFWTVPLILPLAYGATFLMANLYWYSVPGLAQAMLATTSWGQILDVGILANFIRFPYFLALVIALWGTVHRVRRNETEPFGDFTSEGTSSESEESGVAHLPESTAVRRFLACMVAAGLVNSMIAALFLCRLPDTHSVDVGSLLVNALRFVVICALGGIAGSWLYWQNPTSPLRQGSPVPFSLFAWTCAAGWVWVPAMMLFAEQVSGVAAFVAMIGAFVLAAGLRRATYAVFAPAQAKTQPWEQGDLFAESLYRPPLEVHGYLIAFGLFAAGAALATRSNYTAAASLAMSASVFAWKNTVPRHSTVEYDVQVKRAAGRVAWATGGAILLTLLALLDGVAHRNEAEHANANSAVHAATYVPPDAKAPVTAAGAGGYVSVVLWPFPEKKEIIPPVIADGSVLAPGTKKPLIIRFDGPYWFLQPPSNRPGPEAHVAQGTPVSVNIESNNAIALVMNAHQKLARPLPVPRCRAIEIEIENRDNTAGLVSVGMLLTDEEASSKRTVYLGQQPIASTEPGNFFPKSTPVRETIHFALPPNVPIRKFNEITVMFLPDIEHTFVAPKIAIQQFELFPR